MAKNKNSTTQNAPVNLDHILADLLPKEVAEAMVKTGGLTPLFLPQLALEKKLVVIGTFHKLEMLPDFADGKKSLALKICDLEYDTIGTTGDKTKREEVPIAKGGTILVPLTGNLKSNRELVEIITDVEHVYKFACSVTGTMPMKGKNDMYVFDVRISLPAPQPRQGKYMLPVSYARAIASGDVMRAINGESGEEETADGTAYNPATGEVVGQPKRMNASA